MHHRPIVLEDRLSRNPVNSSNEHTTKSVTKLNSCAHFSDRDEIFTIDTHGTRSQACLQRLNGHTERLRDSNRFSGLWKRCGTPGGNYS
jgi:hypothetical protein